MLGTILLAFIGFTAKADIASCELTIKNDSSYDTIQVKIKHMHEQIFAQGAAIIEDDEFEYRNLKKNQDLIQEAPQGIKIKIKAKVGDEELSKEFTFDSDATILIKDNAIIILPTGPDLLR